MLKRWRSAIQQHTSKATASGAPPATPSPTVTLDDLYYAYRLFLWREPDEGGFESWRKLIESRDISIQELTNGFLTSDEFLALREQQNRIELVELPQFRIYVRLGDMYVGATIARDREYERNVTQELEALLHSGDIFLDIGANIGYFTLLAAARVGPNGKVIAFEPSADNCELLRMSIEANGFTTIELYPHAVAEHEQVIGLEGGHLQSNARVVDLSPEQAAHSSVRHVRAVALDQFLPLAQRIDVVKMDIEGAEPRALAGMRRLLETHRPTIVLEFSPDQIQTTSHMAPEAVLDQLRAYGYDLTVLERLKQSSATPQTNAEIMRAYAEAKATHIELMAKP